MDISAEKEDIIKRFNQVHDIGLIKAIKSLLDFGLDKQDIEGEDFDDRNDAKLKVSIQQAINDGNSGRVRPYEDCMAEVRKKYRA